MQWGEKEDTQRACQKKAKKALRITHGHISKSKS